MLLHLLLGALDHLASVACHGGGNLEAWQLADLRAGEAVHGVGRDLESQLAAVVHRLAYIGLQTELHKVASWVR